MGKEKKKYTQKRLAKERAGLTKTGREQKPAQNRQKGSKPNKAKNSTQDNNYQESPAKQHPRH